MAVENLVELFEWMGDHLKLALDTGAVRRIWHLGVHPRCRPVVFPRHGRLEVHEHHVLWRPLCSPERDLPRHPALVCICIASPHLANLFAWEL